ncbi:MAG: glycosyltransferase [Opitutaceae bacterium]|nr:glycosyltransferase [Opitutaceae bacterium]
MFPSLLLALGLITATGWLVLAVVVPCGNRRLRRLAVLADPPPARWPRVSVVFAARNEGHTVDAAVTTMLALDYPDWELVAVNDRSEDDTGAVLEAHAAREPRLRVIQVGSLPPGWLGKTHALHLGAAGATGEFILFTDADIHFHPDVLRRAVAHALAAKLDLLAAIPELCRAGSPNPAIRGYERERVDRSPLAHARSYNANEAGFGPVLRRPSEEETPPYNNPATRWACASTPSALRSPPGCAPGLSRIRDPIRTAVSVPSASCGPPPTARWADMNRSGCVPTTTSSSAGCSKRTGPVAKCSSAATPSGWPGTGASVP